MYLSAAKLIKILESIGIKEKKSGVARFVCNSTTYLSAFEAENQFLKKSFTASLGTICSLNV